MYCLMIESAAPVGFAESFVAPELPFEDSDSLAPVVSGSGSETAIAGAAAEGAAAAVSGCCIG